MSKPMKMWHFGGRGYASEYTVMARTKEKALEYLKAHLREDNIPYVNAMKDYNAFASGKGNIACFDEGEVLETEVC